MTYYYKIITFVLRIFISRRIEMDILEMSQRMDELILLYMKGEDCETQMEEQRKRLNDEIESRFDDKQIGC
jgi:sensor histidine kinase YesM